MRRSKSRNSSVVLPSVNSRDFSSQRVTVYTDKQVPMPLLITAPSSSCDRNFAGTAMRPLASIECSYWPRNIAIDSLIFREKRYPFPISWLPPPLALTTSPQFPTSPHNSIPLQSGLRKECYPPKSFQSGG